MAIDLTFAQLAAQLPENSIIDDATNGIMLNVSALTGDTVDDLSNSGVVEFFSKALIAAYKAQLAFNEGKNVGERILSFNSPQFEASNATLDGNLVTEYTITFGGVLNSSINEATGVLR